MSEEANASKLAVLPLGSAIRTQSIAMCDQIVVSAVSYFTTVLVGWVSKEELGLYGFGVPLVLALVSIVESLLGVPLVALGNRRGDRRAFLGSALLGLLIIMSMSMILISSIASVGFDWLGLSRAQVNILWVVATLMPFYLARLFIRRSYFASLNVVRALILDSVCCVLQVAMLIALFQFEMLNGATGHMVVALPSAFVVAYWLWTARHEFQINWSVAVTHWKETWKFAHSVFASQILWVLHLSAILWSIPIIFGAEQGGPMVGDFLACLSTILLANPFVLGVLNLLGPRAARGFESGGNQELRRVVALTSSVMTVFVLILWMILIFGGDQLLGLVFGSQYQGQSTIIAILGLSMVAETICKGPEQGLIAMERPGLVTAANSVRLLVTLIGIIVWIPSHGLVGAAMSLAVADCIAAAILTLLFIRWSRRHRVEASGHDLQTGVSA